MTERYNVYFAGRLVDGHDLDSVRKKMAKAFNADQHTLDKLFSGEVQLIKSGCDKATAIKYKVVMQRAGAEPAIASITSDPKQATAAGIKTHTGAERIATPAGMPGTARASLPEFLVQASVTSQEATVTISEIELSPPGTNVLDIDERAAPIRNSIDTSTLELDALGQRLSQKSLSPPAMPDTSHLSTAKSDGAIPNLPCKKNTVSPNIDHLTLSPLGSDFRDGVALEE